MSQPRNSLWPRPTLPPPFDISTFDPSTLIPEFKQVASEDPDLCLVQEKPDPMLADSAWDFVRRSNTVEVAPNVLALGKNPFPKLREDIHIPDFDYRNCDPQMPWFGESRILKWLTPHELWERGCINTMLGKSVSRQFQVDTAVAAKACKDRPTSHYTDIHGYKWPVGYCNSYVGSHDGIHPIICRSNFRNTSDYEYECLKPTLRIASRMLEMDSVLDQLWALSQPWTKVPDTSTMKDNYVYYAGRSTAPQRFETAQELRQLSNYVHFDWGNVALGLSAHALTEHLTDKPGLRGGSGTCACKVELHNKFRYVIAGGTRILANLYNPQANNDSSLLRTQLWLAMIIIHELGHVFLANTTKLSREIVPFCNDSRIKEEENALEAAVHKGVIMQPNDANPRLTTSPFGMVAWRWPGVHDGGYWGSRSRRSPQEDGLQYITWYMARMEYIRHFFIDEFWENRILRFGDGALSDFAAVGVRHKVEGSLAIPKGKFDDLTGSELEADEWMPDSVKAGIVYRDKIVAMTGAELAKKEKPTKDTTEKDILAEGFIVRDIKKLSIGMKALVGKSPIKKKKPPKKFWRFR